MKKHEPKTTEQKVTEQKLTVARQNPASVADAGKVRLGDGAPVFDPVANDTGNR
jgi:hypothetical protein